MYIGPIAILYGVKGQLMGAQKIPKSDIKPEVKDLLEKADAEARFVLKEANTQAKQVLEKVNDQVEDIIEKANHQAEDLIDIATSNETSLLEKANLAEKDLLKKANDTEKTLLKKATDQARDLVNEAGVQANDLTNQADVQAKDLSNEEGQQAESLTNKADVEANDLSNDADLETKDAIKKAKDQAKNLVSVADVKAKNLVSEADVQAKDLVSEADVQAKDLVSEADLQAKDLVMKAEELAKNLIREAGLEAKDLVREAAIQTKNLVKEAAVQAKELVNVAAIQAKDLVREAATVYIENKITFLDTAVHELRNPANSISLVLQMVEKEIERGQPLNPALLKRLRPPVDRLIKLVVDLIDMSRLERKLVTLAPLKTNLVSLISQCLEEFRMQAPDCSFKFNQPKQVVEINIDPLRITQVITNLLDNAVKYATGPIEVTLEVMPRLIRVEVTDHGKGVPKEQQKLLFSAFHRGTSEATVKASGLGLGLSICREIIKLHQGTIGYVSDVKGNSFYFELPFEN